MRSARTRILTIRLPSIPRQPRRSRSETARSAISRTGETMTGSRRRNQGGFALVTALFAMATLLLVTASALIVGSANIEATRNHRGAVQVHLAAESGIADALQLMNGAGVVNLQSDGPARLPTASQTFTPLPGFRYVVTAVADAGNPVNAGRLVSTASGPNGERNVVVANVMRSNFPLTAPGVIYLA